MTMATDIHINDLIDKLLFQISQKKPTKNVNNLLDEFFEKIPQKDIVNIALQKFLETSDFWELNIISYLLSKCKDDVSKKSIQEYLLKPDLNDYKRNRLILVLQEHPQFNFSDFANSYPYKVKLANYAVRSLVNNIEDSGENLDDIAFHLKPVLDDELFCQHLITNLCYIYKRKSIWLLGFLAQSSNKNVAEYAITALKKQPQKEADKILHNLTTHQKEENYQFIAQEISQCFLSWLDSYGNQMIVCCSSQGKEHCISSFMINQERGIQQFLALENLTDFKQQKLIEEWKQNTGMHEVSVEKAKQVLRGALWMNSASQTMVPSAFLFRNILPGNELTSEEYKVDTSLLGLEEVEGNMYRLIQGSGYLVKEFPFNQWWINNEECQEYVKNNVATQKNVDYSALQNFIDTFWEDKRLEIARRLLLTADFMNTLSQSEYQKQIQSSLAIHFSLLKSDKPMRDIPFVRQLALINIRQIQKQVH